MSMLTIAGRELRSLFLSPLAWTVLAVVEFILAFVFFSAVEQYLLIQPQLALRPGAPGVTEVIVAPLYSSAAFILLLVAPLITMRLISEERRARTLPLLFSAPLSMLEIVLGKYLGALGFFIIMLGTITLMPLGLLPAATLDFGLLAACLLGMALVLASMSAAGLYLSTVASQPAVAAVAGFGLLLLLWIVDWAAEGTGGLIGWLSLHNHYQVLLSGLFDSSDVIYFLLFIAAFLALSVRRLEAERLQKGV